MNRRLEGASTKRLFTVLAGSTLLILVVLAVQLFPVPVFWTGQDRQRVPAVSSNSVPPDAMSEDNTWESAGDLLERDLKEVWRSQLLIQNYQNAARDISESEQDLLERDLKDAWRAQMSEESRPDLLERDLKELWRAQMLAAADE